MMAFFILPFIYYVFILSRTSLYFSELTSPRKTLHPYISWEKDTLIIHIYLPQYGC